MSVTYLRRLLRGPLTADTQESSDEVGMTLRRSMVSKLARQFLEVPTTAKTSAKFVEELQRAWQDQVMRLAATAADADSRHWYRIANCRPVGYKQAGQPAKRCSLWRVCPWCHVRHRLIPVYKHLLKSAFEPESHSILSAMLKTPDMRSDPGDLFYRPDYMPVAFRRASHSLQVVSAVAATSDNSQESDPFFWQHSIVGVLPKTTIEELNVNLLRNKGYDVAIFNPESLKFWLGRAMEELLLFPVKQLYAEKNLDVFRTLFFTRSKARTLRTSAAGGIEESEEQE